MNDRMIWLVRIVAIFVFLLLAYLLMSLHAKLRRMQSDDGERRVKVELQIADCRLQIVANGTISPEIGYSHPVSRPIKEQEAATLSDV